MDRVTGAGSWIGDTNGTSQKPTLVNDHPRRPSLNSPDAVLDNFVISAATLYASRIQQSGLSRKSSEPGMRGHNLVLQICQDKQKYQQILASNSYNARQMLDMMQDLIDSEWVDEQFKTILDIVLLRLARRAELYPRPLVFDHFLQGEPLPSTTIGTTTQSFLDGKVVGIKISGLQIDSTSVMQMVLPHIQLLARLRHANVLPLSNICDLSHDDSFGLYHGVGLVSPFLQNGNSVDFLQRNPDAARRSLIIDAASGLSYLHDNGVVHGTLHGQNILVASTTPLRACLADSGFASIIDAHSRAGYKYRYGMVATRGSQFLAPEDEYSGSSISRTQASDVYALATCSYMILTDNLPLEAELSSRSLRRPAEQIHRDRGLNGLMWQLMVNSWWSDPEGRPSAGQIAQMLNEERNFLSGKVTALLRAILSGAQLYKKFLACSTTDAQEALDAFQWLLDTDNFQDRASLIAAMRRLSESMNLFPAHFYLKTPVPAVDDQAVAAGKFADVFKVELQDKELCLKVIRISGQTKVEHIMKVYAREAIIWAQLSHPNILPFYGLTKVRSRLSFVTRWAANGDLEQYLNQNPSANRILLCCDTAAGVGYLHKNNVVHGDLKGVNVLVDSSGRASLGDFGLSSVTDPQILEWTSQSTVASKGGTTRWQAPELLRIEHSPHNSKASDVFAWANVCYEIFTEQPPFFETHKPVAVMNKILNGATPTRPDDNDAAWQKHGLNNNIWDLMQDCWKAQPSERLDITEAISRLGKEKPIDSRPPSDWEGGVPILFWNAQAYLSKDPVSVLEGLDRLLSQVTSPGI